MTWTINRRTFKLAPALLATAILLTGSLSFAQSAGTATAQTSPNTQATPAMTRAQRRAARRRFRAAQQQAQGTQPDAATAVSASQRRRDAQILAAQKARSNEIAKENHALTQKVVQDQQKQQAEPRIQDAPGPESQPLAGDPAVAPVQSAEPPRIQDAPGPAQTLPKTPPPASSPAPAPQP